MNTSLAYKIIQFFKLIGLIPSTTSCKLFNVFAAVIVLGLLSFSCYFYITYDEDKFLAVEITFSNATVTMAGMGCVLINHKLYNIFLNIFSNKLMKLPNKQFLLAISILFYVLCVILTLKIALESENQSGMVFLNFVCEEIFLFIGQIQKLSFTFMLGSIVKFFESYLSIVESDIKIGFDDSLYIYLESYNNFKSTISFCLFLIFCFETINLTFFIYFGIRYILNDEIYLVTSFAFWNIYVISILVYIALIADDCNQIRLQLTENLW